MGFRSRPGSRLETQMRLRVMPTGWLIEKEPVTMSVLAWETVKDSALAWGWAEASAWESAEAE